MSIKVTSNRGQNPWPKQVAQLLGFILITVLIAGALAKGINAWGTAKCHWKYGPDARYDAQTMLCAVGNKILEK